MSGRADYLDVGNFNALCDRCGGKYKASELKFEWDGLYVCPTCWEPRNPLDYVKGVPDIQTPPWTRPDPPPVFVTPNTGCTAVGRSAIPDYAMPDCSIPDTLLPPGLSDLYANDMYPA